MSVAERQHNKKAKKMDEIEVTKDGRIKLTLLSGKKVLITSEAIMSFGRVAFPKPMTELRLVSGNVISVQEGMEEIIAACTEADGRK